MSAIISKAQLAEELGVTRARVSQHVAAGMPVRTDGKLDRETALAWVAEHVDPAYVQGRGAQRAAELLLDTPAAAAAPAPDASFQSERTRRERAQATQAELELAEKLGNTLWRQDVEDAAFESAALLREAVDRRAPMIAQRLVGITDVNVMTSILGDELRAMLGEMSDELERRFAEPEAAAA